MKKKLVRIMSVAALLLTMSVANAQIFITGEDIEETSPRTTTPTVEILEVPTQGVNYDQSNYAPLGSGLLILAGLSGLYAVAKRRKKRAQTSRPTAPTSGR